MKSWKGHNDFYSCNRFEKQLLLAQKLGIKKQKSKRKAQEDAKEKHRRMLDRYLHYYERFVNHENSRKLEKLVREKAIAKMKVLQLTDATWAEVQFIAKGVDELLECREVLKHTYVFAYYFLCDEEKSPPGAAKELFEYLQEDLEKTTERLSEVMEDIMERDDIEPNHKIDAINQIALSCTKKGNLLHAVARDPLFELP